MKEVKSIITGVVLAIQIHEGEQVSVGQEVVIVESMKMAIPIESSISGTVSEIKVRVGQFVSEDDVLLTII
ncbi:acetyl-CoA carboxylase biotin carboxyl carrier protein subunit [Niallia sp. XMNu-256]|uniref:acetyl-CoA carboxylase biotin carboxyl carrier protein subunit n=1 Tax=Niallia sp. XMNu-256 TaxID=3082444 RepID=UPI0030CF5DC1